MIGIHLINPTALAVISRWIANCGFATMFQMITPTIRNQLSNTDAYKSIICPIPAIYVFVTMFLLQDSMIGIHLINPTALAMITCWIANAGCATMYQLITPTIRNQHSNTDAFKSIIHPNPAIYIFVTLFRL